MRDYRHKELYPNTKLLSSSQVLLYEESPEAFYKEYVLGVRRKMTNSILAGVAFSELFANRSFDYVKYINEENKKLKYKVPKRVIELLGQEVKRFPELPKKNCEVGLKLQIKGRWRLRVTLDGLYHGVIIENKTGQVEWTQDRVDDSDQLTLQALAVLETEGKKANKIMLNWLDTSARANRKIYTFTTKRSVSQLKDMRVRLLTVVENLEAENFNQRFYY